jgi:hypothetical protein
MYYNIKKKAKRKIKWKWTREKKKKRKKRSRWKINQYRSKTPNQRQRVCLNRSLANERKSNRIESNDKARQRGCGAESVTLREWPEAGVET